METANRRSSIFSIRQGIVDSSSKPEVESQSQAMKVNLDKNTKATSSLLTEVKKLNLVSKNSSIALTKISNTLEKQNKILDKIYSVSMAAARQTSAEKRESEIEKRSGVEKVSKETVEGGERPNILGGLIKTGALIGAIALLPQVLKYLPNIVNGIETLYKKFTSIEWSLGKIAGVLVGAFAAKAFGGALLGAGAKGLGRLAMRHPLGAAAFVGGSYLIGKQYFNSEESPNGAQGESTEAQPEASKMSGVELGATAASAVAATSYAGYRVAKTYQNLKGMGPTSPKPVPVPSMSKVRAVYRDPKTGKLVGAADAKAQGSWLSSNIGQKFLVFIGKKYGNTWVAKKLMPFMARAFAGAAVTATGVGAIPGILWTMVNLGLSAYTVYQLVNAWYEFQEEENLKEQADDVNNTIDTAEETSNQQNVEQPVSKVNATPVAGAVSSVIPSNNETPQATKVSTDTKSGTLKNSEGLSLLNQVMDEQGITDKSLRDRIIKLAQVESSMNPSATGPVLTKGMHKGDSAKGLLQIMPLTAKDLGYEESQLNDPKIAAEAGVKYFMQNYNRFGGNLDAATVAHHSGPGGAQKWLNTGSAGTKDLATGLATDDYLKKVTGASVSAGSATPSTSTTSSPPSELENLTGFTEQKLSKIMSAILPASFTSVEKDPTYQYKATALNQQALEASVKDSSDSMQQLPGIIMNAMQGSSGSESNFGSGSLIVNDPSILGLDYQRAFGVMAA